MCARSINMTQAYDMNDVNSIILESGSTAGAFDGHPYGCFENGNDYVFYSVLLER